MKKSESIVFQPGLFKSKPVVSKITEEELIKQLENMPVPTKPIKNNSEKNDSHKSVVCM